MRINDRQDPDWDDPKSVRNWAEGCFHDIVELMTWRRKKWKRNVFHVASNARLAIWDRNRDEPLLKKKKK